MRRLAILALLAASLMTSGCGYNRLQAQDEQITAAWAEVLNQSQRRADLIPNLVATVKGYAEHEQETLTAVIEEKSSRMVEVLLASISPGDLMLGKVMGIGLAGLTSVNTFRRYSEDKTTQSAGMDSSQDVTVTENHADDSTS